MKLVSAIIKPFKLDDVRESSFRFSATLVRDARNPGIRLEAIPDTIITNTTKPTTSTTTSSKTLSPYKTYTQRYYTNSKSITTD